MIDVLGGGGVGLHVRRYGRQGAPPVLFLHGWSQNHLSWRAQFESDLAESFDLVVMDLRGHGASQAPEGPEHYTNGDLWAQDVHAVIETLGLVRPVLVGWSYGGLVVADYLRRYGDGAISGVNFVSASLVIGKEWLGTHTGPTFLEHASKGMSKDPVKALEGMIDFVHACAVKPIPQRDIERAIAFNMLVRPDVRRALSARTEDFRDMLEGLRTPALVTHGEADTVIMPQMAQDVLARHPDATASWYPGVGHMPFMEEPERFNRELADFVRRVRGV
ncbi:MAG TPA: alpha/beta hydrolase [Saliniramus sp.]|nr:alpha/beta hydrolase [Saliniramus sp.]